MAVLASPGAALTAGTLRFGHNCSGCQLPTTTLSASGGLQLSAPPVNNNSAQLVVSLAAVAADGLASVRTFAATLQLLLCLRFSRLCLCPSQADVVFAAVHSFSNGPLHLVPATNVSLVPLDSFVLLHYTLAATNSSELPTVITTGVPFPVAATVHGNCTTAPCDVTLQFKAQRLGQHLLCAQPVVGSHVGAGHCTTLEVRPSALPLSASCVVDAPLDLPVRAGHCVAVTMLVVDEFGGEVSDEAAAAVNMTGHRLGPRLARVCPVSVGSTALVVDPGLDVQPSCFIDIEPGFPSHLASAVTRLGSGPVVAGSPVMLEVNVTDGFGHLTAAAAPLLPQAPWILAASVSTAVPGAYVITVTPHLSGHHVLSVHLQEPFADAVDIVAVDVVPGPVNASLSTLSGDLFGGPVDTLLTVSLAAFDSFRNAVTNTSGVMATLRLFNDVGDEVVVAPFTLYVNGTWTAEYMQPSDGLYTVHVAVGTDAVPGSPFPAAAFSVLPSANHSYVANVSHTTVGRAGAFHVQLLDGFGRPISAFGLNSSDVVVSAGDRALWSVSPETPSVLDVLYWSDNPGVFAVSVSVDGLPLHLSADVLVVASGVDPLLSSGNGTVLDLRDAAGAPVHAELMTSAVASIAGPYGTATQRAVNLTGSSGTWTPPTPAIQQFGAFQAVLHIQDTVVDTAAILADEAYFIATHGAVLLPSSPAVVAGNVTVSAVLWSSDGLPARSSTGALAVSGSDSSCTAEFDALSRTYTCALPFTASLSMLSPAASAALQAAPPLPASASVELLDGPLVAAGHVWRVAVHVVDGSGDAVTSSITTLHHITNAIQLTGAACVYATCVAAELCAACESSAAQALSVSAADLSTLPNAVNASFVSVVAGLPTLTTSTLTWPDTLTPNATVDVNVTLADRFGTLVAPGTYHLLLCFNKTACVEVQVDWVGSTTAVHTQVPALSGALFVTGALVADVKLVDCCIIIIEPPAIDYGNAKLLVDTVQGLSLISGLALELPLVVPDVIGGLEATVDAADVVVAADGGSFIFGVQCNQLSRCVITVTASQVGDFVLTVQVLSDGFAQWTAAIPAAVGVSSDVPASSLLLPMLNLLVPGDWDVEAANTLPLQISDADGNALTADTALDSASDSVFGVVLTLFGAFTGTQSDAQFFRDLPAEVQFSIRAGVSRLPMSRDDVQFVEAPTWEGGLFEVASVKVPQCTFSRAARSCAWHKDLLRLLSSADLVYSGIMSVDSVIERFSTEICTTLDCSPWYRIVYTDDVSSAVSNRLADLYTSTDDVMALVRLFCGCIVAMLHAFTDCASPGHFSVVQSGPSIAVL